MHHTILDQMAPGAEVPTLTKKKHNHSLMATEINQKPSLLVSEQHATVTAKGP